MKNAVLITALMLCTAAWAADPQPVKKTLIDHSNHLLITEHAAKAVMGEHLPAKVFKIYPASRFAFISQVEGGMKGTTCVVSARVMLVPLTAAAKAVLFRPQKMATAFDAAPNSSTEACRDLARDKLKEATEAVASALVKV
ncbi:MAG: hypothetical protein C0505_12115 [Leptothrix sp. (in: Bacteria)]|nr:hypothetical protein [Leptothrix sp. (in: b-proteobacteria)]